MRRCLAVVLSAALTVACASGGDATEDESASGVRIGAFDFAESELLAELYAQALEAGGIPVERLGVVGPREIVAPALEQGRLDLVPEYVGAAATHHGATTPDLPGLRAALEPRGLLALAPAAAANQNVVVVTRATAEELGLVRISDLAPHAAEARFGGPVECPERPLCLLGLEDVYGLRFADFVPQRSLQLTAEALVRGEIDVALMFSTSGALAGGPFVVLEDDLGLQPAENVVPVLRADALERWGPGVRRALDGVSAMLTTLELRALNRRVLDGDPVPTVAADWLPRIAGSG